MNIIDYFMSNFNMTQRSAKAYRTRMMKQLDKDPKIENVTDDELLEILSHMSSKGKYAKRAMELLDGHSIETQDVETNIAIADTVYCEDMRMVGFVNDKIGAMAEVYWKYIGYEKREMIPLHKLRTVTREEGRELAGLSNPKPVTIVEKKRDWIKWKCGKDTGMFDYPELERFCKEHGLKANSVEKCIRGDMKTHKKYTFRR
jgi:rRNA processing protein Gar1